MLIEQGALAFHVVTEVRLVDQRDLDPPRLFLDGRESLAQLELDRLDRLQALRDRAQEVFDLSSLQVGT